MSLTSMCGLLISDTYAITETITTEPITGLCACFTLLPLYNVDIQN
jgi:hypothetical protein